MNDALPHVLALLGTRLVRSTPDLPAFHHDEFMWMASVENRRKRLTIHLYKHDDTRCYLNLDDGGHAYEFIDQSYDRDVERHPNFSGRYRLHRTLHRALRRLGLWEFEHGNLWRSFPPSAWPSDASDVVGVSSVLRQPPERRRGSG